MNPFAYLEADHKKVATLLAELEDTTERAVKTREALFMEIDDALMLHTRIEEEVVYPVLEELKKTHDIVLEGIEEHHVIKVLLEELAEVPENTEQWTAKLKVLKESVEHHVEEEEGTMFPKARHALTQEQKEELAQNIEAMAERESAE